MMLYEFLITLLMLLIAGVIIYHDTERLTDDASSNAKTTLTPAVFVSITAALISCSSLVAAFEQSRTTQLNYIAAYRPWIGLDDLQPTSSFEKDDDGKWKITATANIQNYGHSPVSDVLVTGHLYIPHLPKGREAFVPQELTDQRKWCQSFKSMIASPSHEGRTIFPGKSIYQPLKASVSKKEKSIADQTWTPLTSLIPGGETSWELSL